MLDEQISWDDIELFLKLAHQGSFAKAALALGLTQPTVSRRLKAMEESLGVVLFNRSSEGVNLTPAGEAVLNSAAQMERSASHFVKSAKAVDQAAEGSVGLSAPDGLSAFWIVPRLREFLESNPKLQVSVDCGLWPTKGSRLLADVALMATEPEDLDAIRVPICWLHYSFFSSAKYLSKHGTPLSNRELVNHRMISHVGAATMRDHWDRGVSAITELAVAGLITNSSAASLMAVREGVGITALPTLSADIFPDLVPLPLGGCGSVRLFLCYSDVSARTPKVRAVINWLRDLFDPKQTVWLQEDYVDPFEMQERQKPEVSTASLRLVQPI